MSFGDDVAAGLRLLRGEAVSRMRDTCIIVRPGAMVTDDDGNVTQSSTQIYPAPGWPDDHPHADGKCYTRYPGLAFEQNREVGGATIVDSRIVVRVPFGVAFRPGDLVTITSSLDNPQLAGTVLRVMSIDDASQTTAQRLLCSDIQAGLVA